MANFILIDFSVDRPGGADVDISLLLGERLGFDIKFRPELFWVPVPGLNASSKIV